VNPPRKKKFGSNEQINLFASKTGFTRRCGVSRLTVVMQGCVAIWHMVLSPVFWLNEGGRIDDFRLLWLSRGDEKFRLTVQVYLKFPEGEFGREQSSNQIRSVI